jgi:HTH-type transcriptional regulator / antitoxin HigA
MEARMTNFSELSSVWQHLHALAPEAFAPIANHDDLRRATAFLISLDHEIGEVPGHALASLANTVMQQIMVYEAEHFPIGDADGAAMLAFYLDCRGLTQQQVARATGISQGILSRLLNRKRQFTADHARTLGAFFKVGPGMFL